MTDPVRLVVFVTGNESRGDDAAGPALLRELESELPQGVRVVHDFQLQVEHALELHDADLALFIDAECGLQAPFAFGERDGDVPVASFSHALSPSAILAVFRRIEGSEPPPAFILGVRAERFELGEGLSEPAAEGVARALAFARELLRDPCAGRWRSLIQARARALPRLGKNSAV